MNKTNKWLNHIIELFIVIVGISIAFSINNYSENRKEAKLEKTYLKSFLDEIDNDIPKLDTAIQIVSGYKVSVEKLVSILEKKIQNADSINDYIRSGILSVYYIEPSQTTFESLHSSGKLALISNFELRKEIINYNTSIENLQDIVDWEFNFFNDKCLGYLPSLIKFSVKELVNDDELYAIAGMRMFLFEHCISKYETVKNNAINLKKRIEEELVILN